MANRLCDNCKADSGLEATDSLGGDMARLKRIGWQVKNLILYTDHNDVVIACSEDCHKVVRDRIFAERGVTSEDKATAAAVLGEMKAKIPGMVKETQAFMSGLTETLRKGRKAA